MHQAYSQSRQGPISSELPCTRSYARVARLSCTPLPSASLLHLLPLKCKWALLPCMGRPFAPVLPAYSSSLSQKPANKLPVAPCTGSISSGPVHVTLCPTQASTLQVNGVPTLCASFLYLDTFIPSGQSREEALPFCPIKRHQRQRERVGHGG